MTTCQACEHNHECVEKCIMVMDEETGEYIPESATGYLLIEEDQRIKGDAYIVTF